MEQSIPVACPSISRTSFVRTSGRGAFAAIISRTRLSSKRKNSSFLTSVMSRQTITPPETSPLGPLTGGH